MTAEQAGELLDRALQRAAAQVAPGLLEEAMAASRREAAEILKSKLTAAMVQEVERLIAEPVSTVVPITSAGSAPLSGWYVYGIARAEATSGLELGAGVDGAPVETIRVGDLVAVVSPLNDTAGWDVEGHGESALETLAPRARAHETVLERMMDVGAGLPLRFGVLYPDVERLRQMLQDRATAFRRTLNALDGHSEWGLTITSERAEHHPGSSPMPPDGRDYLSRRRAERQAAQARTDRLAQIGAAIHQQLQERCAAAVAHSGTGTIGRHGDVLLRASYLVPTASAETFRLSCEELLTDAPSELHLVGELTGPWPPYHFCDASLEVSA